MERLPFSGVRVLDSTYVFALPYAGGLMADLGAEVIKVEGPGRIDVTRVGALSGAFPENIPGEDWWNRSSIYNVLNRGKMSLTLDLSKPSGRALFAELVKISDVVMENYTPRVMKGWGLDYPNLRKLRPDVIMVSNTGYGHGDGPYSDYPAQATTQEATHGHCGVTGYIGGPPSKAGQSFVDFLASWTAVFTVAAALRLRQRTGQGQWIDIGMYQCGVMFLSEFLMDYIGNGRVAPRMGNRHPFRAPQGVYPARGDDQWIVLSVGTDAQWRALCDLMGKPHLAHDPRFVDSLSRLKNHDALDTLIAEWTRGHDRDDLIERLQAVGIPAGPVFHARDIHLDPHYAARGFLECVEYPPERGMGRRPLIGRPFKAATIPARIQGPAPRLGEHNEAILVGLLGLTPEAVRDLEKEGIIAQVPRDARLEPRVSPEEMVRRGALAFWDPEYRRRLGVEG
ncbi:MAG: CoA transferase [Dehalococcoidia bacterium]|nr:CoA transferase [Dehalococcoidia bacterium]MDW8119925.1 CoA transferase [Chloroflexota bacterium]